MPGKAVWNQKFQEISKTQLFGTKGKDTKHFKDVTLLIQFDFQNTMQIYISMLRVMQCNSNIALQSNGEHYLLLTSIFMHCRHAVLCNATEHYVTGKFEKGQTLRQVEMGYKQTKSLF